jgi:RNA polymerase sigma-70 factor (ECF subfamily)
VVDAVPDEAALVGRARTGDAAAYARLVEAYQEIAFRLAYLITGSAADAEDAAQSAFLKAFAGLHRFRVGSPLRPWLLRIVANEARNRRRSERRQARLPLRVEGALPRAAGASETTPEDALLAAERHERLVDALARLREEERLAVVSRYLLDLSEAEAATVLGWRRGTVKSRLSRGLAHLRADLGAADA